jgi:hypothetical protein
MFKTKIFLENEVVSPEDAIKMLDSGEAEVISPEQAIDMLDNGEAEAISPPQAETKSEPNQDITVQEPEASITKDEIVSPEQAIDMLDNGQAAPVEDNTTGDDTLTDKQPEDSQNTKDTGVDLWGGDPKQFADIDGIDNTDTEDTPISLDKDTPKEEEIPTGPATSQEKLDMIRLHKSYSDDSSVDRKKLQMYRQAKQELGPDATWRELAKKSYEKQYGSTGRYMGGDSSKSKPQKSAPAQPKKSPKELVATDSSGKPLYFVRISSGNYRPAVQADVDAGVQLFARNPNSIARNFYPYIKIQNMPTRRPGI